MRPKRPVWGDAAIVIGQLWNDLTPEIAVHPEAVDEYKHRPCAAFAIVDLPTVHSHVVRAAQGSRARTAHPQAVVGGVGFQDDQRQLAGSEALKIVDVGI